MTGLSVVRTLSRGVVRLAGRHGGAGDRPTDGKIKAPPSGLALVVGRTREFRHPVAVPCRRFQSTRRSFQCAHRHRPTGEPEITLEHA
jgi:hypothetical protein